MDSKFWNNIYQEKSEKEISWFQEVPTASVELIEELELQPNDRIIDIGGGESHLVDALLDKGFQDISILDISSVALEKSKTRLADRTKFVKLINSDVTQFDPPEKYHLCHDRATFHFLTNAENVETYLNITNKSIAADGYVIVSTFSKSGPEKCSGLPISRYSDTDLKILFEKYFTNIRCFEHNHNTPWNSTQNFVYCEFKKRPSF